MIHRAVACVLFLTLAGCGSAAPGAPTEATIADHDGAVRAQAAGRSTNWLTFESLTVVGSYVEARVHVEPVALCPPIQPPTYGAMEVWVAPHSGVEKEDAGGGDWLLKHLAFDTHYRVFAWYTDTCGNQHTSDEIAFDTPEL